MTKELSDIPRGLRGVYGRFQRWRNKHPQARLPIPKRLWLAAGEAARENGVGRTAQALGLEYGKLKRLAESSAVAAKAAATKPTFVELIGPTSVTLQECIIEFESLSGGKVRIQWKGAAPPDWTSLLRAWRDAER